MDEFESSMYFYLKTFHLKQKLNFSNKVIMLLFMAVPDSKTDDLIRRFWIIFYFPADMIRGLFHQSLVIVVLFIDHKTSILRGTTKVHSTSILGS